MNAGKIRRAAHQSIQRVDLAYQVPFADPSDRRVAGHLPQPVRPVRQQASVRAPTPRRGCCRLAPGMSAADHHHIEPIIHTACLNPRAPIVAQMQRLRNPRTAWRQPTNPTTPATAAAPNTNSGCTRVNRKKKAATTIIAAAVQSTAVVRISSAALAVTSPAVTGSNPACNARRQPASRNQYYSPLTTSVSTDDSAVIARPVATNAPDNPGDAPSDQAHHHQVPDQRRLRQRDAAQRTRARPSSDADPPPGAASRRSRVAAADRQQRELAEHQRDLHQDARAGPPLTTGWSRSPAPAARPRAAAAAPQSPGTCTRRRRSPAPGRATAIRFSRHSPACWPRRPMTAR